MGAVLPHERLDDRHRHAGLSGPCRHHDQRLPMPFPEVLQDALDVLDALRPIDDCGIHLDREGVVDLTVLEAEAFEVFAGIKPLHFPGGVTPPIPEQDLVAVREEDEDVFASLRLDVVGVLLRLLLPDERVFRGALCLDDRQRCAQAIEEEIIDVFAFEIVFQGLGYGLVKGSIEVGLFGVHLRDDMGAVGDVPALLSEEDVDLLSASLIFVEIHRFEPSAGMRGGK